MSSSSRNKIDVHRLTRAMVLLLAGAAMTWLAFQENSLLLSARVRWRSQAGGIVLILLAVFEIVYTSARVLRFRRTNAEPEGEHHQHGRPRLWPILLPLILFPAAARSDVTTLARNKLFLPSGPTTVGASVADESSVGTDEIPSNVPSAIPDTVTELFGYTEDTLPTDSTTVLTAENFFEITEIAMENPEFVRGRRFRLSGFVYRDEAWPATDFVVGRLLIYCCAADASLVGMYVRTETAAPPADIWVEVEGVVDVISDFRRVTGETQAIPIVVVDTIRMIDEPEEFYVLPPF